MSTYVILSGFSPRRSATPPTSGGWPTTSQAESRANAPPSIRKDSFATLGRFHAVDIVEADNPKEVEKAAMIIRAYGHSTTETLLAGIPLGALKRSHLGRSTSEL